jgi:hypothetical protein
LKKKAELEKKKQNRADSAQQKKAEFWGNLEQKALRPS